MNKISLESPSVQSYLSILQAVIGRMGTSSASCKTWCVALVSATAMIISDKGNPNYLWVSIIPLGIFFFLDSFYLSLERRFRHLYNKFIRKLHSDSAIIEDVFIVTLDTKLCETISSTFKAAISISVWPFYSLLAAMLIAVRIWIL